MSPSEMRELAYLVSVDANRRMSACSGKSKFSSFDLAKSTIRHKGMLAYHCRICLQYHVGTTDHEKRLALKDNRERLRERSREVDEKAFA